MTSTDISRILYGSSLSRPKNAIFATIVLVVLLLTSLFSLFQGYFAALSPAAVQVFVISQIAVLDVTLLPLAILWFLNRRELESRWLYLIAVLWGGTDITPPANVTSLMALYGAPSQTGFGSAVFYEDMKLGANLEAASLRFYQHFS